MKTLFFYTLTSILFIGACQEGVRPNKTIDEVPDAIIPTKPCATLYPRIIELFPEYKNNEERQQILFSDTVQSKVILTRDTEIYLTYISEGAGNNNTFGWYAYDQITPPLSTKEFEWHVLFPNVSNMALTTGDRLQLGSGEFKAGTVIGFFLIVSGWQQGTIDYTKPTLFTDSNLNTDHLQQHILFEEKTCGDIVLAFEDTPSNLAPSDHDFNDIIFTVSDNNSDLENTSFEQHSIISW